MKEEINDRARKEAIELDQMLDSFYKDSDVLLIPEVEKAYSIRASRISNQMKLRRAIEEIYTPEQQLTLEAIKVSLEIKKAELKLKETELKTKKIDLGFKDKEAKAYGVDVNE
ncbi:MAG: hypothetical protein RR795_02845 [Cetobacterium sp.]|uniref:hypothetical protein n=1 Tax=Cetobacterium sp. TaxID=2071632 RepID=UPI002FCA0877